MGTARKLLVIGERIEPLERVLPLLRRAEVSSQRAFSLDNARAMINKERYDLIIIHYPEIAISLTELVDTVRSKESPCRTSGLLVVAERSEVGEVGALLGRGVNRVVDIDAHIDRLLDAIADLLAVKPRRFLRSVIQLDIWVGFGVKRILTVTENVSITGMLVRGGSDFAVGTRLQFELLLPHQAASVRGDLAVVRHTDRVREGVEGFGARILGFVGDDEARLRAFLDAPAADPADENAQTLRM
ncbi:MAG TPA: hypothetical protein P5234_02210 [Thermoanaerobaculaceae bacterium]|nr:hypothetical protein [Thermoanaerobaculaceae bacterium]HRS15041.1 hypothetical protein [Thermoanaerobaculaceae bacterium]